MSSSNKRKNRESLQRRIRIENLIRQGNSISKAAKVEGCSYRHAKQIFDQMEESSLSNPELLEE